MAAAIKFVLVVFIVGASFMVPTQSVFAQPLCDTIGWLDCAPTGPQAGGGVLNIITNLTNWLFVGFMLLAVVIIIFASWQFISSSGDPQNVAKARSKLLWAVIAIVIAVISGGIPVVVKMVLGV
jgi:hypothetical protein